jgi:tripartite-type tricarboxylate transporter receptor subunit TctC
VWHTVPVKSIDDLRQRETVYAAVGTGTASAIVYPTLLNAISGTRIKLVRGYQGTPNVHLAMERGEVEGVTGSLGAIMTSAPEYLTAKKVRLIMQYQFERSRDLPDVPAVMELIQAPADRELFGFFLNSANIGRSILAPPGLSRERLEALRRAFSETMRDPEFIAEMAHGKLDLSPLAGSDLQLIVRRQVEASPELKASIHAIQWKQ